MNKKGFDPEYFKEREGKVVIIKLKKDLSVNVIFENQINTSKVSEFIIRIAASTYIGWVYKCSYNTLEVLIPVSKNGQFCDNCICKLNASDLDKFDIYVSD